jgi:hypothetical protein
MRKKERSLKKNINGVVVAGAAMISDNEEFEAS